MTYEKAIGTESTSFPANVRAFVENIDACIYIKGTDHRYVFANRAVGRLFGMGVEELIGKLDESFIDLNRSTGIQDDANVFDGASFERDHELFLLNGRRCIFHTIKVPLRDEHGIVVGLCGISIDVSMRERAFDQLVADHQFLSAILSNVDASIFVKNSDGQYLFANPPVLELYGRNLSEVLGRSDDEMLDAETAVRLRDFDREVMTSGTRLMHEEVLVGPDGHPRHFWTTKMPLHLSGQASCLIGISTDITELLRLQRIIEYQRVTDSLTGLANRIMFESTLDDSIANQPSMNFAVSIFDVDQFRYLNSSLGQSIGDELLRQVGTRLGACCPVTHYVARLAGDEFGVFFAFDNKKTLESQIDSIRSALSRPFTVSDRLLHISFSTGISLSSQDGKTASILLAASEAALYAAKETGRGQCRYYSSEFRSKTIERAELERDLRASLGTSQYQLFYQPKIRRDGSVAGLEALLRWERPGNGMTSPDKFIPLAEQLGLLLPIGRWVIEQACSQIASWRAMGLETGSVAVNLSAAQLASDDILEDVEYLMDKWCIPHGALELELTESMMMSDPEMAIRRLTRLRELGVTLSIDDFGTGFSSMSYLRQLPVHCLKIDKCFVSNIAIDQRDANLCNGIISLAHMLNMKVIAEGVETRQQFDILMLGNCDIYQGYFFSRPLRLHDTTIFLQRAAIRSFLPC